MYKIEHTMHYKKDRKKGREKREKEPNLLIYSQNRFMHWIIMGSLDNYLFMGFFPLDNYIRVYAYKDCLSLSYAVHKPL